MAKSLKEALLEQMATLQERGLAPGELPVEQDEQPSYAHYDEEGDRRQFGGDRDGDPRRGARGRGPRPRGKPAAGPRLREQRETREPIRRERREGRGEQREIPPDLVGPMPAPPPRAPFAPRPVGQPGFGRPPMMGGPMVGGPRPAPRSDMLRRNAERIQREQADLGEVRRLLSGYTGQETDEAAMELFFSQLAVETGALPPLNVALEALRAAGSADAAKVGNQVRLHYRRARSRVAPAPVGVS